MQVRVRSAEQTRHYVTHALSLFREKGHRSVVLKAMGKAINRLVAVGGYLLAVTGREGDDAMGMGWGVGGLTADYCRVLRLSSARRGTGLSI